MKKDLRTLIHICEQYNIISAEKCSEFLQMSEENCNGEFFGWIFRNKKVNDLRLAFYDVERDLLKEIDEIDGHVAVTRIKEIGM